MKTSEVKAYSINVCQQIVENLAKAENLASTELKIRIDLKDRFSKPVFALFNSSGLIRQITLSEIISAGGGKGLAMMLSMTVRNLIRDIFLASLKRFEKQEFKEIFLLLTIKNKEEESVPFLSVFVEGKHQDSLPVGEIVAQEKQ